MIGWVDASAGAAGDMLLGALVGAGVPVEVLGAAVDAVAPEPVRLEVEQVLRGGLAATRVHVLLPDPPHPDGPQHRTWRDVRRLLTEAALDEAVRRRALAVFATLAEAEAAVHGVDPDDAHFHEVGALDAIADVVGVCAGFAYLGLDRLVASTVAVGSGRVVAEHGSLPVPVPAVVELLRGVPSEAGPATTEACTPTGAALLVGLAGGWGPQPAMTVSASGAGAGHRDPSTHANVTRLLVGAPADRAAGGPATTPEPTTEELWVLETNLDDLDPRLLPGVLDALLALGALDAWLTPIVMKKGRPAHTVSALLSPALLDAAQDLLVTETSTLGVRAHRVQRASCDRELHLVEVGGQPVEVKVATWRGRRVNAQPEFASVVAAATVLERPVADVLAEAAAAARAIF